MFASESRLRMLVLLAWQAISIVEATGVADVAAQGLERDDECSASDTCALNALQLRAAATTEGEGMDNVGANRTTELSTAACVGQTGWDTTFAAHCYTCGFRNMANAYRSGRCMAEKQGVSQQCGSCIGQLIHCGTQCIHECCFGHCFARPSCAACQQTHCNQAFFDCAGASVPEVPEIASALNSPPAKEDDDSGKAERIAEDAEAVEKEEEEALEEEQVEGGAGMDFGQFMRSVIDTNRTTQLATAACDGQTGWDTNFAAHCYECGFRNMANAYRSGRCMAQEQGVSAQCGSCIGQLIHCGTKCLRQCCYGRCYTQPSCRSCQATNCNQAFFECAGAYPPNPAGAASVESIDGDMSAIKPAKGSMPVQIDDLQDATAGIAITVGDILAAATTDKAAKGDFSIEVWTGPTGPTGGADSVTELSTGACVGQQGWDTDFAAHSYNCGFRNMANAYRSGRCMAREQGVSLQCGSCIGQLIHCGTKCLRECCYGHCYTRPSCTTCQEENCNQAFFDCAGMHTPSPTGSTSVESIDTEAQAIAHLEDEIPAEVDALAEEEMTPEVDDGADEAMGIPMTVGDILAVSDSDDFADEGFAGDRTMELSTAACVGQAGWDTNFASHCYECGFRNMANAYRSGRCMAQKQGVSEQCGSCIGQLIHCGTQCIHECCFGHCFTRPTCTACQETHCNQGFFDCAGVHPPQP